LPPPLLTLSFVPTAKFFLLLARTAPVRPLPAVFRGFFFISLLFFSLLFFGCFRPSWRLPRTIKEEEEERKCWIDVEINEAPPLLYNEPVFGASILSVLIFHSTRASTRSKDYYNNNLLFPCRKKSSWGMEGKERKKKVVGGEGNK
jgi:hypothetical protein